MKLKQRDIALISFAVSLLLVLSWYFVWYQPKGDEIVAKQGEKETLQIQVDRAREASAALPQLREEVARLEIDKQEFLQQLPETVRFAEVLQDLRRVVAESGSTMNSVSPSAAGAAPGLPAGVVAINVNMGLETTFPGLLRLVSSIQALQRFSTINNVNLSLSSAPSGNLSNPTLNTNLNLTVYTFDVTKAMQTAPPAPPAETPTPEGGNAS